MRVSGSPSSVFSLTKDSVQRMMGDFKFKLNGVKQRWWSLSTPYRGSVPAVGRCEALLGQRMEKVKDLMYLGTFLCKHGVINYR